VLWCRANGVRVSPTTGSLISAIATPCICSYPADSFHFATAKDPSNYEANYGVSDIIQVATAKEGSNKEFDNSDSRGDPYQCDIMPSLSDDAEEETEFITDLRGNPDPSLNYWDGVAFHESVKALNNALIREENYYRDHKKMHIHLQGPNIEEQIHLAALEQNTGKSFAAAMPSSLAQRKPFGLIANEMIGIRLDNVKDMYDDIYERLWEAGIAENLDEHVWRDN
jgi:hypothetical protein